MNRRQFLSSSTPALCISLTGCTQGNSEEQTETEAPSPEDTDSGCRETMCEGTQIIEVDVSSGFSGTAVLETSCRDEPVSVESGESVRIVREEDGEECGVTLFLDGEQVYSERVEGHASAAVTVTATGEVEEEAVML